MNSSPRGARKSPRCACLIAHLSRPNPRCAGRSLPRAPHRGACVPLQSCKAHKVCRAQGRRGHEIIARWRAANASFGCSTSSTSSAARARLWGMTPREGPRPAYWSIIAPRMEVRRLRSLLITREVGPDAAGPPDPFHLGPGRVLGHAELLAAIAIEERRHP